MSNWSYVYIFIQSNLLEIPIYFIAYFYFMKQQTSVLEVCKITSICNLITHPIVFFFIMTLKIPYIFSILIAEAFAIVSESFLHNKYFRAKPRQTVTASIMANLVSWQVAPAMTYFIFY